VIIANTHSTSRAGLEPAGLGDRVDDINRRAVEAALRARDAAAAGRPVAVAGSISSFIPSGMGSDDHTDLRNLATFQEQARILADAGVDLLALEMMDSSCYGLEAIQAATETGLPVWLGMSPIRFPSGRLGTYAVDTPCIMPTEDSEDADSFVKLVQAYAEVHPNLAAVFLMHVELGVISEGLQIVRAHFPDTTLGVYAEVGHWQPPNWEFADLTPAQYLTHATGWADAGVQIIGSCCGTGPDFTRALTDGLPKHVTARQADAARGA
jgi:S-methylmethionine-dependent homocysteine/selenocysteine methylase